MKKIHVYLVRHGETIFNVLDKLQGWSDSPLTDTGIQLAKSTGENLSSTKFNQAYSSDMKRAIDTAQIIVKHNQHINQLNDTLPAFREAFFGSFEGLDNMSTWATIASPYGFSTQAELLGQFGPFGVRDKMAAADKSNFAENGSQFSIRITNGLLDLLNQSDDNENILIVSHGTLIRALTITYGGPEMDAIHNFPKNGGITKLTVSKNEISVDYYNQLEPK